MSTSHLPTGTITFLLTDIEGSTRLWEQAPDQAAAAVARHDQIIEAIIDQHRGSIVRPRGEGDSRFAVFPRATDAVAAAAEIQQALHSEPWPTPSPLRVRMALHTGEGDLRAGDYYGSAVNRCARLRSVAHGGQTLLSHVTHDLVRDSLPAGIELRHLGEHRLKDLQRPEQIFQLVAPGLPADFPPLKTLDARPSNLPATRSPLIGRLTERAAVQRLLLRENVGLLTLTGPGGVGKTRLALQVAADLLEAFPDGVYFISLAHLTDHALVPNAIAHTLGVNQAASGSLGDLLANYLSDKQLLLVLDNFEQVIAAAPVVVGLLATAPCLKVLVTSREVLHVHEEQEFAVPPLGLPDLQQLPALAVLSEYEAVALFIQRARLVKPDFEVTKENAAAIVEICHRLDGLPLAIELAAARIRLFPPEALLPRLASRLQLLTGGARDLPERQQTLRRTIQWSYDLLQPAEQRLFRRMAVFAGGSTVTAIEAICDTDGALELEVLDGVASLVDKSLVRHQTSAGVGAPTAGSVSTYDQSGAVGPEREPRFGMLETIREYGLNLLRSIEPASGQDLYQHYAQYYLDLTELAEPELTRAGQAAWLARLEQEYDNLREALAWLCDHDPRSALRMAVALDRFWSRYGHLREGRGWLETMVERTAEPDELRGQALVALASVLTEMGEHGRVDALLDEALSIYEAVNDPRGLADVRFAQANAAHHNGDYLSANKLGENALARYRELGDRLGTATALHYLASFAMYEPDLERAAVFLEESAGLYDAVGDRWGQAMCALLRGLIALFWGKTERGVVLLGESLRLSWELGDRWTMGRSLAAMALAMAARGEAERAVRLWAAADALLERIGVPLSAAGIPSAAAQRLAGLREWMGEERWAAAERAGRALPLDEAIAEALATDA